MKKQLIALAVASAVATPVMAQNVSVYGALDLAVQNHDTGTVSLTKTQHSLLNTQRLGFKGSEDLGGGLKANFMIQTAFSDSDKLGAGTLEEQWVGLSGSFGEIRLGTTDMSGLQALDSTVSGAGNLANSPKIATSAAADVSSAEDGADTAGTIRYISPVVNGFQVDAGYTAANNSAAVTDGNGAETSVLISYKTGNLGVYAGQHEKDGAGVAKMDYRAFGARYDFGMAAVGVIASKGDGSATANNVDVSNTIVTVNVPLGNGLTAHASRMSSKIQDSASKATGTLVALTKTLSKRTTVYGAYTSITNEAGVYSTWGGVTTNASTGTDPKAMTVGISHTF